jgi:hypothetical protein
VRFINPFYSLLTTTFSAFVMPDCWAAADLALPEFVEVVK